MALSSGQWAVMKALWRVGRRAVVYEVQAEYEEEEGQERDYRTIQTTLNRMAKKGWVTIERVGPRRCFYSPAVGRKEGIQERVEALVEELVEGDPETLKEVQRSLETQIDRLCRAQEETAKDPKRRPRP